MKFQTFSMSASYWFKESPKTELPGISVPLRTIVPEFTEDMSRRNVVRVNLRDNVSARQSGSSPSDLSGKRQKVTHDFFPTKPPTPHPTEKERTESSTSGGLKAAQKPVGSAGKVVQEFATSFASAEGRLVTLEDSVKAEPGLAVTMLQGLALPKDMENVPQDFQPSLVHASAYLVQLCSRIEPHSLAFVDFVLYPTELNMHSCTGWAGSAQCPE